MTRKLIRYALYLCGSLLLAVLLYGVAAVLLGNWRIQAQNGAEKADITVYLISNGAHTDITMPLHPSRLFVGAVRIAARHGRRQPERTLYRRGLGRPQILSGNADVGRFDRRHRIARDWRA